MVLVVETVVMLFLHFGLEGVEFTWLLTRCISDKNFSYFDYIAESFSYDFADLNMKNAKASTQ